MAVNPIFNQVDIVHEQNLVSDVVAEVIQIHGANFYYIKRDSVNEDTIFNERTLVEFHDSFLIEMYIETANGWAGEGDFLSKFGLEIKDQLITHVSIERFQDETGMDQPLPGDLLYFPLADKMFSITFIEDDVPFFQLGKQYIYKITTELFDFSHEVVDTGLDFIDDNVNVNLNIVTVDFTLGSGSGDFIIDEIVYQGVDFDTLTASGKVISWNNGTKVLKLEDLNGNFIQNNNVKGDTSGSIYMLGATHEYIFNETSVTADNDNFSVDGKADEVIDFSVKNPFSETY
jgi:hypothetical protein